jgi:hypothetical protein
MPNPFARESDDFRPLGDRRSFKIVLSTSDKLSLMELRLVIENYNPKLYLRNLFDIQRNDNIEYMIVNTYSNHKFT